MAFKTTEWFRTLMRQEHAALGKNAEKANKAFREFIDNTLPFALYLDLELIEKRILQENLLALQELADRAKVPIEHILSEFLTAYSKLIDKFHARYTKIDSNQLENKLSIFTGSPGKRAAIFDVPSIKATIKEVFDKTYSIQNVYISGKRVLILAPSFSSVAKKFGSEFRDEFNFDRFSDILMKDTSPRSEIKNFFSNLGNLQNLGHIEVDILPVAGTKEALRGISTPKLLAASLDMPPEMSLEQLTRKFSEDTGQAETRIIIQKKFEGTRLVMEILIEAGILIGSPESTGANAQKAAKEMIFELGKSIGAKIVKNPNILVESTQSRSAVKYIGDNVASIIETGKPLKKYSSTNTVIESKTFRISKLEISKKQIPAKTSPKIRTKEIPAPASNFDLLAILRAAINQQVRKNMGTGSESKILNYRTGRFSESVTIDYLTESRQGMISVFYNYMKNPYATFSQGGRQQYPRTRDPKLLISKSIRDIAVPLVGERLRAVLV